MSKGPTPDHYATLGVPKTASEEEIKKAYRDLCKQHHPDIGGDADKMKAINVAYDVLSNADKRKQYDNPIQDPNFNPFGGGQQFDFQFNGNPFGGINLEDILNNIHGFRFETNFTRGDGARSQRVVMLNQQVVVPFDVALIGGDIQIRVFQLQKSIKFPLPPMDQTTMEFKVRLEGDEHKSIILNLTVHVEMPKLTLEQKQGILSILTQNVKVQPETKTEDTGSAEATTP